MDLTPTEPISGVTTAGVPGPDPTILEQLLEATDDADLVAKVTASYRVARALFRANKVVAYALSGGKDSTVATLIGAWAYRDEARASLNPLMPMVIISSRTLIENPEVDHHLLDQLASIEAWSKTENLDIRISVGEPSPASSWQVRVAGGRGNPTFANSAKRDCSVFLKIEVNRRSIARIGPELKSYLLALANQQPDHFLHFSDLAQRTAAEPIVVLGSRFAESTERQRNMDARGEKTRIVSTNLDNQLVLPLIADFAIDGGRNDIWWVLGLAGTDSDKIIPAWRGNFDKTRDLYRNATGECVVVNVSQSKSLACGARFGCSLCTVTGASDKSMEAMLIQPQFGYMKGLNRLRNWLVATRYDHSLRRWTARTKDKITGYARLLPDVYSPETCKRLLHWMLTLDAYEQDRARTMRDALAAYRENEPFEWPSPTDAVWRDAAFDKSGDGTPYLETSYPRTTGLQDRFNWPDEYMRVTEAAGSPDLAYAERMSKPQFQLIRPDHLVLIDLWWARYGMNKPFGALAAWHAVHNLRFRYDVPEQTAVTRQLMPAERWLHLPEDPTWWDPLFDPIGAALGEHPGQTVAAVSGSTRPPIDTSDSGVEIDEEALAYFIEYDLPWLVENYHNNGYGPEFALGYYARSAILRMPSAYVRDNLSGIARHTRQLLAAGVRPDSCPEELAGVGLSAEEHNDLRERLKNDITARELGETDREDSGFASDLFSFFDSRAA